MADTTPYGKYTGTGADAFTGYDDLHDNPGNPYNDGSRNPDDLTSSTNNGYGALSGSPAGYYTNPPVGAAGTKYDTSAILAGPTDPANLDETLPARTLTSGTDSQPTESDYWADGGFGPDGQGRS